MYWKLWNHWNKSNHLNKVLLVFGVYLLEYCYYYKLILHVSVTMNSGAYILDTKAVIKLVKLLEANCKGLPSMRIHGSEFEKKMLFALQL